MNLRIEDGIPSVDDTPSLAQHVMFFLLIFLMFRFGFHCLELKFLL